MDLKKQESPKSSDERFRKVFDLPLIGVGIVDGDMQWLAANERLCETLGYTADELKLMRWRDLTPEEDLPAEMERYDAYLRGPKLPATFEKTYRRKDGRTIFAEVSLGPVLRDDGSLDYFVVLVNEITQKRESERRVRESEEFLKAILSTSPIGIARIKERRIEWANDYHCRLMGYSPDEMIGQSTRMVYETDEEYERAGRVLYREGQIETKHRRKDGTVIDVLVRVGPMGTDSHVVTIEDITERKRIEEALAKAEEEKRLILDSIPELFIYHDRDLRILWVNRAAAQRFEKGSQELVGKLCYEARHGATAACPGCPVARAIETGLAAENEMAGAEGRVWYVSGYPVKSPEGKVIGAVEIRQDISERKRVGEALRQSEERYRRIFENAAEGIFQSTPEGRFITVNPALARMCGFDSPEEMISSITDMSREHYVNPEDRARFVSMIEKYGSVTDFEHETRRKDGTSIWVSVSARLVRDGAGNPLYYEGTHVDVTERKKAEEAIKRSEARYKALFDNANDAIFLLHGGRIVDCNESSLKMFGGDRQTLIGETLSRFSPLRQPDGSDSEQRISQLIMRAEAGERQVFEWKHQRCSGGLFDAEVGLNLVAVGDQVLVQAILRDVTERKIFEEGLREKHQQLRDIIEFLPDATFVIDRDKKVLAWNRAIEEMTGVAKEGMLGKGDYSYAVPFYGIARPVLIDLVFERHEETEKKYDFIEKVGDTLFMEVFVPLVHGGRGGYLWATASPLFDISGNIIGAIESIRDVTERKRIERALQESEERYRTAIEASNDAIAIVKGDRHLYVNRKFLEIFGFKSQEEVVGHPVNIVVHPDDKERVLEINRRRQKDEEVPRQYEFKGVKTNGDTLFIEVSAAVTTFQGEPISLVYLRNVTERKALEAQLLQAQKMEAVGTLAGGVAHDFNNILMALMGYANLLQMKMDPGDPLRVYVDQIVSSTGKAANLTQSLLAFSRKQIIELKPCDVSLIVRDVTKLLRRLLPEDIELALELAEQMTIMGDAAQIDQVLINLATNARDAMPRGGGLKIETGEAMIDSEFLRAKGYGKAGAYIRLSVSDNGIGMSPAVRDKIFEPFFTTKETGKGTGLGLSIVYGIVKQHNGYIDVDSEPGRGTTFHIYFPRVREKAPGVNQELIEVRGGTETILFAEDNNDIRKLATEVLAASGYTILQAVDGQEAVERFAETPDRIDLVILDVVMPRKNGREAYDEIVAMRPDTKVLFMSGYTGDVVLDKGIGTERFDYVAKPLSPPDLLRKVRDSLDKRP